MTALKPAGVAGFLKRPDLTAGVFLCYGPDGGLVRETAQSVLAALTRAIGGETSVLTLDAAALVADPGRLAVETGTTSLFGERQLLRIREADKRLSTQLATLLADPGEAVVVLEAGNLAPRDALRALVEAARNARALPCYADSAEAVARLVTDTFSAADITLEPDARAAVLSVLGNDREITRRELEKLVLFASSSGRLTEADVLTLCADNGMLLIDDIIDAAATGHGEALDKAFSRAMSAAVDAQQILTLAAMHFQRLRVWRQQVDIGGKSPAAVVESSRPPVHFSRRDRMSAQLRLWRDRPLADVGRRLHQATAATRLSPSLRQEITWRALIGIARLAVEA